MAAALRHQGAKAKNRRVSRQMESESKSEEVFRQIAEDNDMLASEVSQWYLLNILEPGQWWYENFYRSSDKVGEFRASLGAKSPGLPRGNIRKIDDEAINPTEWWDDFLEAISESYTKTIQGRHLFSVSNFEATWAHAIDRIYEQTIEKGVFPAEYEKDSRERIFKILRWTFEDLELKKSALHTYFRRPGSPIEVPAQQDGNKKRQNLKSSPAAKSPTPKRYRSGTPSSDTA
ncbi:hypothetical protein BU16DRAFT_351969 [Lophium mytilinum]|uniref:Uncharacterized protein n=1 Tax=Lophium mytilinum TaxID=390894 RepID=A0A6A6QZM2_9PEZI|nr:hypothetical protein BU16DRAFT_351969 [Lophium mytilinum]